MELDLDKIASARARNFAAGGMGYLLARVRRELAQRWAMQREQSASAAGNRVLVIDFADADDEWRALLDGAQVDRRSAFDAVHDVDAVFDAAILCLQPAWMAQAAWMEYATRALRPGGLLLLSTFGPDTLAQVRWAWSQADDAAHVHPFTDMHIIGDQLLAAGFARPVLDVDRLAVEYADADALHADLRAEGFINIASNRRKALTGKHRFARYRGALDNSRESGAPLAITFELIYGIAAAPPPDSLRVRVTQST